MAIVAGVLALATAAAATGAAAAAGGYGIYKYFKKKAGQRNLPPRGREDRDSDKELDFGEELEVYKVTEIRLPPPVAPKPKRGQGEATASTAEVTTKQPSLETSGNATSFRSTSEGTSNCTSSTAPSCSSQALIITRLCPNAVKVLPDASKARVALTWKDTASGHRLKDSDCKDVIMMKTLHHHPEEEI